MADAIHRTTLRYVRSVDMTELPGDASEWVRNPTITRQAQANPQKYWKLDGDTVRLMNATERQAVDAAELQRRRDAVVAPLSNSEDVLRALLLALLDDVNELRASAVPPLPPRTLGECLTAIRGKLGS